MTRFISFVLTLAACALHAYGAEGAGASTMPADLGEWLRRNGEEPVKYVVGKFETHDIVFVGEHHYVRHDAMFIQSLIPALYAKGVRNLGIEFGCRREQELVDRLLGGATYDEELARRLMFKCYVLWGYQEYIDLYRVAWKLNSTLGAGRPKFRIVHLNAEIDWSQRKKGMPDSYEVMRKVWVKGYGDEVMAKVILEEFVAKGQKALIYSGMHHALTRFDERPERLKWMIPPRMAKAVYERIGEKAFNISLHAGWMQQEGGTAARVGGVIDEVVGRGKLWPVGFDVRGTPFGRLVDRTSIYARGRERFVLEDFCDGYVFLRPREQAEMVGIDEKFVTEGNVKEAIEQMPDPEDREKCRTAGDVMRLIRESAEAGVRSYKGEKK